MKEYRVITGIVSHIAEEIILPKEKVEDYLLENRQEDNTILEYVGNHVTYVWLVKAGRAVPEFFREKKISFHYFGMEDGEIIFIDGEFEDIFVDEDDFFCVFTDAKISPSQKHWIENTPESLNGDALAYRNTNKN